MIDLTYELKMVKKLWAGCGLKLVSQWVGRCRTFLQYRPHIQKWNFLLSKWTKRRLKVELAVKPISRLQNRRLEKPVSDSQSIFIDSQRYRELP